MKTQLSKHVTAICILSLMALQCNQQKSPEALAAEEEAIRQADIAWSKAAEARDLVAYHSYFVDNAAVLVPNEPLASGKEAIRKMADEMFAMPGFTVKWQPTMVKVASCGDWGYSIGTYEMSVNGPDGKPVNDNGKYMTVWKKQADKSWKVAADMFNSDLPLPR